MFVKTRVSYSQQETQTDEEYNHKASTVALLIQMVFLEYINVIQIQYNLKID